MAIEAPPSARRFSSDMTQTPNRSLLVPMGTRLLAALDDHDCSLGAWHCHASPPAHQTREVLSMAAMERPLTLE